MKLIPVDLCGWDFDEFIKNIDTDKVYLAKINDEWTTGKWSHSRDWCVSGGGWDFNYGMTRAQGSCRGPDTELDRSFIEMYEIYDEDLIIKKTIEVLSEKKEDKIKIRKKYDYCVEDESLEEYHN